MDDLLLKLFAMLRSQTGLDPLPLNPGCADAEIVAAEARLQERLPDGYKDFLKRCNGQSDPFLLTFPPDQLAFLSIEEVVSRWLEFGQTPDDQFFDELDSTGRVRSVLHHIGRVPIAENEAGGAYLALDNIPGPKGKKGQVVFNVNEIDVVVVASSFHDLIRDYVRLLESGRMAVKKQPPRYGRGFWFVAGEGDMLDWPTYEKLKME